VCGGAGVSRGVSGPTTALSTGIDPLRPRPAPFPVIAALSESFRGLIKW